MLSGLLQVFHQSPPRNLRNQKFFGGLDFAPFGVSPNINENFLRRRFRFFRRSGELSRQCPDETTVSVKAFFNGGLVFIGNPLKDVGVLGTKAQFFYSSVFNAILSPSITSLK